MKMLSELLVGDVNDCNKWRFRHGWPTPNSWVESEKKEIKKFTQLFNIYVLFFLLIKIFDTLRSCSNDARRPWSSTSTTC